MWISLKQASYLLGEKPFGIDRQANAHILEAVARHPEVVVRCASEFPYFPACQESSFTDSGGKNSVGFLEVKAGFNHASDLDVSKPINWKRRRATNGEYGCMGDLGISYPARPLPHGLAAKKCLAVLSDVVRGVRTERAAPSRATHTTTPPWCANVWIKRHGISDDIETKRLSPGSTNEWYLKVSGMKDGLFHHRRSQRFHYLYTEGKTRRGAGLTWALSPCSQPLRGHFRVWVYRLHSADVGRLPVRGRRNPGGFRLLYARGNTPVPCVQTAALQSWQEKRAVDIEKLP